MIGGLLADSGDGTVNVMLPPLVAAGLSATAMVLALVLLKPGPKRAPAAAKRGVAALAEALRRPALKPLVAVLFVTTAVFAGMEATFALWTERALDWGPRAVGLSFAYAGVIAAIVQGGLIGRLSRRFGEDRLLRAGILVLIAGFLLLPLSGGTVSLLAAMTLLAAGFGLTSPSLHSLISRRAAADSQGASLGVAQSANSLARVVGPVCAGIAFSGLGRDWPYFLGALVLVAVSVALLRLPAPARAESTD
jgi:DHA1 family tetracycline resistance protein-like MFS transporter